MIDFTPISRPFMRRVFIEERRAQEQCALSQQKLLGKLLSQGEKTAWGAAHGFGSGKGAAGG